MPSAPPGAERPAANVNHSFDGEVEVLHATFDRRVEIRKALTNLQLDLQKTNNHPVQIQADIKINISGQPASKQHVYTVSVTDNGCDSDVFSKHLSTTGKTTIQTATPSSPSAPDHANGKRSSSGPDASKTADSGDRLAKRICMDEDLQLVERDDDKTTDALLRDALKLLRRGGQSGRIEDLFDFIRDWHSQWAQQGGWLFDMITKASNTASNNKAALERRMEGVQDIMGQSINASSASTMAELANINKLIPWLEHCRKTSADKTQQREEKWRSSSATFHDTTRKDRELAEKRLEEKLEEQKKLLDKQQVILAKLAEANGIDPEEWKDGSREESLGAQLTAELSMEAVRIGDSGNSAAAEDPVKQSGENRRDTINVIDDET